MDSLSFMPITSRCGTPAKVPFKKPEYAGRHRDHPNYLAMKCKTSALDIKKRDEMRENRSISRELLIQKFVNKYGPRMKRRIILQVDALMSSKRDGNITDEEDKQLDAAILSSANDSSLNTSRTESSEILPPPKNPNEHAPPPLLKIPKPNKISPIDNSSPTIRGESCCTPIPTGAEWEAVRIYQNYLAEKQMKSKELQDIQRKKQLSYELSQQVSDHEKRRELEKEMERAEAEKARMEYEKYRQQVGDRYLEKDKGMKELRDSWEEQIIELKRHLEDERIQNVATHQMELEELSHALAEEEELLQQQRQHIRQFYQETVQYNEKNFNLKSFQRQTEIQKEREVNEAFELIQKERDQHRYDEIKKSMERVKRLINWAEISFPRPVTPSEFILKKTENELKKIAEEGKRREVNEKEIKKNLDILTREINYELIQRKDEEKRIEKRRESELNEKLQEERRRYEEEKIEIKRAEREKRLELGEILKRQEKDKIAGGTSSASGAGGTSSLIEVSPSQEMMTSVERELNRVALDAVQTDPILNSLLQSRLSHRMRMSARGAAAGGTSAGGGGSLNESNSDLPSARPSTRLSSSRSHLNFPLPSGRLSARPATTQQGRVR